MKTRFDVITRAHRRIGVIGQGENLPAEMHSDAEPMLDGILAELEIPQNLTLGADTFDDVYFLPLAYLLAVDLAPQYEIQPRDIRSNLIARLRAIQLPDDRTKAVTDAEKAAELRASYY